MHKILARAIVVLVIIATTLIAPTGFAADKTLPIGVLGPMSGSAASYGLELVRGAEMKVDEINRAGGLTLGPDRYTIKLVIYDHKASAAEASTATNKLVFQDKVKFIIGNAIGATTNAAQSITEPAKVLFAFASWGTKNLGPDKPYSFRTILSQWEVAEPFYRWLRENHPSLKRVALIAPNDTSGLDTNLAVNKVAVPLGFTIVAEETYERGTKDFYPVLTKILSRNPEMVDISAAPTGDAGLIAKQLWELGFRGRKGWTAGTTPTGLVEIAGKQAAEGLWTPANINVHGQHVDPAVKRFALDYEKRYKETPGVVAVGNYAAFDVITRAMRDTGSVEPERVLDTLTKKAYQTVWGSLVIGGKETYGIDRQFLFPFVISEVRDGKLVEVTRLLPDALKRR